MLRVGTGSATPPAQRGKGGRRLGTDGGSECPVEEIVPICAAQAQGRAALKDDVVHSTGSGAELADVIEVHHRGAMDPGEAVVQIGLDIVKGAAHEVHPVRQVQLQIVAAGRDVDHVGQWDEDEPSPLPDEEPPTGRSPSRSAGPLCRLGVVLRSWGHGVGANGAESMPCESGSFP
jgi:hypothetical protein